MAVGEIIKYFRERNGLTQGQLGEGICTPTHVSKIENGKTAYSFEIISMFSERLQIDIEKEMASFQEIEKQLNDWHNAIIMKRMKLVEEYKKDLESIPYISSSKYAYFSDYYRQDTVFYMKMGKKHTRLFNKYKKNIKVFPYSKEIYCCI